MLSFDSSQLNIVLSDILLAKVPAGLMVSQISTDTRKIMAGDCFAAISGEQFDGHDFVEKAMDLGAGCAIVSHVQTLSIPQILVRDTRLALARIAANIRQQFAGKVIGLTGSVGKTTNKQMLQSILSLVNETHATKGNLNNDLGVPFTFFDLPMSAEFAVIEMGANHQQEIAYLSQIVQPDVAMITNAGAAHLEGFGGLDGVAKGKGELFQSLSSNSVAVINDDDDYSQYWQELLSVNQRVLRFSRQNSQADVYASEIKYNNEVDSTEFILHYQEQTMQINLPVSGEHNVSNAVGSATCAIALGVPLTMIAQGLAEFELAKGRQQALVVGQTTIVDDTYNANPTSVRAAAELLATKQNHRIFVLGDMGELGIDENQLHGQLGQDIAKTADSFYCLGEKMMCFYMAVIEKGAQAQHFTDYSMLNHVLLKDLQKNMNATIWVKGSRTMQMERVVTYLLENLPSSTPLQQ